MAIMPRVVRPWVSNRRTLAMCRLLGVSDGRSCLDGQLMPHGLDLCGDVCRHGPCGRGRAPFGVGEVIHEDLHMAQRFYVVIACCGGHGARYVGPAALVC
jgi:hypothetical protein